MKLEISEYAKIHNMSEEEIYRAYNEGKLKITRNKEGMTYVDESTYGKPVYVTDLRMDFSSMVAFMVKLSFAAIPALIIVTLIIWFIIAVLGIGVNIIGK
jgi:hypothetical protein